MRSVFGSACASMATSAGSATARTGRTGTAKPRSSGCRSSSLMGPHKTSRARPGRLADGWRPLQPTRSVSPIFSTVRTQSRYQTNAFSPAAAANSSRSDGDERLRVQAKSLTLESRSRAGISQAFMLRPAGRLPCPTSWPTRRLVHRSLASLAWHSTRRSQSGRVGSLLRSRASRPQPAAAVSPVRLGWREWPRSVALSPSHLTHHPLCARKAF